MAALREYPPGLTTLLGHQSAREITRAYVKVARGELDAAEVVSNGLRHAVMQGVHSMRRVGELLRGIVDGPDDLNEAILTIGPSYPWHLTFLADLLAPRLSSISEEALRVVESAAKLHPDRWRTDLRQTMAEDDRQAGLAAAGILEEIGDRSDIVRLRQLAKGRTGTRSAAHPVGLYPVA